MVAEQQDPGTDEAGSTDRRGVHRRDGANKGASMAGLARRKVDCGATEGTAQAEPEAVGEVRQGLIRDSPMGIKQVI